MECQQQDNGIVGCNPDRAPEKFRKEIKSVPNFLLLCYNFHDMSNQIHQGGL
jgi:hypothetical protein